MFEESERKERKIIIITVAVALIIFLIPLIEICTYSVRTYNELVNLKEEVENSKANVEIMLQRRLELIPDLVEIVNQCSKHKEKIYEEITSATTALAESIESGNLQEMSNANSELTELFNSINTIIVKEYPNIETGEEYTSLMSQLEGSVNRIAIAREFYNENVSYYNAKIKEFPTLLIASIFGFEEIEPFKAAEKANSTNIVDFSN